jgi:hypothetical protein
VFLQAGGAGGSKLIPNKFLKYESDAIV